jgi:hypothetical protein
VRAAHAAPRGKAPGDQPLGRGTSRPEHQPAPRPNHDRVCPWST